ncbi:hypothetical protein EW026_g5958 [Hermanssonia centrifuga]|uniref:alpha-1,2-Mannosidase n=1 Tax=Hermanssonia centrifuga TaxID=98765 RepID=A0A4V6S0W1_9APHY|nr:hypothetical protein EW026_g5958 [Hermanssonia centrifuga]
MDFARACLPKSIPRLITFVLGASIVTWTILYIVSPHPNDFDWLNDPQPYGRSRYPPLRPPPRPSQPPIVIVSEWDKRAEEVKDAFLHAYRGYEQYAAPHDELLPLTSQWIDNVYIAIISFNGWGVTLIDALDTMWIMDLREEFYRTLPLIANLTFSSPEKADNFVPFFETVIRYLGGLLSGYALSGESLLITRADDLGQLLLHAFDTDTGLPMYAVDTATGATRGGWASGVVLWSEALSCQMEYKYLAHLTGRPEYYDKVEHIMNIMRDTNIHDGMFPTKWSVLSGRPTNGTLESVLTLNLPDLRYCPSDQFSVGAFADSAHEYLLKQWLMSGKSETKARDLYLNAANAILKNLLYLTPNRKLLYVTDTNDGVPSHTFEHLSCFLPGLLALGAHNLPLSHDDKQLHMWAAQGLAYTCWITYADHISGLGPDEMIMDSWPSDPHKGRWLPHVEHWKAEGSIRAIPPGLNEVLPKGPGERDYFARKNGYLLRPETVESFYLLWRTTGNSEWRERGWLKYLYLLFREDDVISLDQWVFNTEAHPLPIFQWTNWEKQQYGIV